MADVGSVLVLVFGCGPMTSLMCLYGDEGFDSYRRSPPPVDIHGTHLKKSKRHKGHRQDKKRRFGKFPVRSRNKKSR